MLKSLLFLFLSFQLFAQSSVSLPRSTPESQGISSEGILAFLEAVSASDHEIHSLMVLRHGKVIAEAWWKPYGPDLKHTMYSVSKSFTATAIGFAVAENKLSVEDKVVSFFPEHLSAEVSPFLAELRIKDLLSMSVGHEKDPTGEVVQSDNWVETFLNIPIAYQPGTRFLYNTAATYMLSAIIQKVTGDTLMNYLKPRLFDPLGIEDMDWETDPNGVNTGGYGLRIRTEDMAKFGQLFLQKGYWNGEQLLPKEWIEEASSLKILQDPDAPQEKADASDWLQGYCYQMWCSRHNSYRADGAFGQYILILPKVDAVIAITSETSNMQDELDLVWEHLLPAFQPDTLADNPDFQKATANLYIAPLKGDNNALLEIEIANQVYEIEGSENGIADSFTLDFKEGYCELRLTHGSESNRFSFGSGEWVRGETDRNGPYLVSRAKGALSGLAPFQIAGSYAWNDGNTLELQLKYIESPHTETIRITFDDKGVLVDFESILNRNAERVVYRGKVKEVLSVL